MNGIMQGCWPCFEQAVAAAFLPLDVCFPCRINRVVLARRVWFCCAVSGIDIKVIQELAIAASLGLLY